MSFALRVSSLSLALSMSLICAVFSPAQSSSSPPTVARSQAESELRAVVEKYFALYAGKDLDGLMSLWSEKSPDYASHKQNLQGQFATEDYSYNLPTISRVRLEEEKASLRATVNLTAINLKSQQKREQRIARNFALVREDGKWKVWRYAPTENDLAEALAKAKTEAERTGLLADEKELAPAELVRALGIQGDRFYEQGDYPQALALHRLAQKIAEQSGDQPGLARTLNNIGKILYAQGNFSQARSLFQQSLALLESLNNQAGIASALNNIGNTYFRQDNYTQALEHYQKSLALSEAMGDQAGLARTLGNIGNIYSQQGDNTQALEHYQKSLTQFEALGAKKGLLWPCKTSELSTMTRAIMRGRWSIFRKA